MLPFYAHKNSDGFTLIEAVIILFIVGILSAISAPSFLGLLNRGKVNNAVAQVKGALQEAQVQAIRKSKKCTVTLKTTSNEVTGDCLVTGDRTLPKGVTMATNIDVDTAVAGNPIQIKFGIRGNTKFPVVTGTTSPSSTTGKILLYQSNGSISNIKCVAISNGIGILRSGNYSGNSTSTANITDGNCIQPQ